ncbi:NUDIX hydrolase [Streptomyces sp. ODS28]|uniref:NUDIX hydrolase n=1 Tax=Streptomyces sp. ODS28 TaxID=3136688 RepID=UPI0031EE8A92
MTATTDHGGAAVRAAVLVTTGDGRVLLAGTGAGAGAGADDGADPGADARTEGWALPVAVPAAGESLYDAAQRAVAAATGLSPRLGELLAVDRAPSGGGDGGEYVSIHVLDGGGISPSAIRRVEARGEGRAPAPVPPAPVPAASVPAAFVPADEVPEYVAGAEARRVAAALSARAEGRSAPCLEDGRAPRVQAVMRRYGVAPWVHSGSAWVWHAGEVPEELAIRQAWVWVFAPDGRVVVYLDENGGIGLPGGTLEDFEHRAPAAAAVREVHEETSIRISGPLHLGYVLDQRPGDAPVARVRLAAAIDAIGPSAPDPATGTVHRRLLVPPQLIAGLCGWGAGAGEQTRAALEAAAKLGITPARAEDEVTEIPADGSGVLPSDGTGALPAGHAR